MNNDLLNMSLDELKRVAESCNEKAFRAKQLFEWLHKKQVSDLDEMSNLSKEFRTKLKQRYRIGSMNIISSRTSLDHTTHKFLLECSEDGELVEAVLLAYKYGSSLCISSQIGCNMGCNFCASTVGGRLRNLSAGEMLSQIYTVNSVGLPKISHVVIMGMGEPLDNFDNLVKFVIILNDKNGYHMSRRNITVSTCGIVPKIYELADKELGITLAISLHSAFDEKRKTIMPIANRYSIEALIGACSYYFEKTGRRLTFEYSLINGFNAGYEDAVELAKLAKKVGAHVNLIPVNKIDGREYTAPKRSDIRVFKDTLEKHKANVTIRRSLGQDIDGACGQLRKRYLTNEE